jgi:NADH:ubiquinone oxidoreductase subunit 3 (subunit A)
MTSLYILSVAIFQVLVLFVLVAVSLFAHYLIALRDSNVYSYLTFECGFDVMVYQHITVGFFVLCVIFLVLEIEYLVIILLVVASNALDPSLIGLLLFSVCISIIELNSCLL